MRRKMPWAYMAIIAVVAGWLLCEHVLTIARYERYDQEAEATVDKVASKRVRSGRHRRRRYQVSYTYYVDDAAYHGVTDWISTGSNLQQGDATMVRFNSGDPGECMLAIEKQDSVISLWAAGIVGTVMVVMCCISGARRKGRKRKRMTE